MHARELKLLECRFANAVKFFVGHFFVGRVIDAGNDFAVNFIGSNLSQKNVVGTNRGFRLVLTDRVGNELWRNGPLYKNAFGLLFGNSFHGSADLVLATCKRRQQGNLDIGIDFAVIGSQMLRNSDLIHHAF